MWRSVLAVILVPSLVLAQEQNPIVVSGGPEIFSEKLPQPTYQAYTEQRTIRQGTTEKASVVVSLGSELIVSPRNASTNVVPLKIEFGEAEGITVTGVKFPKDGRLRFTFQADQIGVLGARFPIELKVKAARNAALGERVVRGKLSYQAIRGNGVFPRQQMDVLLPVMVVAREAQVTKSDEYMRAMGSPDSGSGGAGTVVLFVLLAPILIPLALLNWIVCGITGQDCRC